MLSVHAKQLFTTISRKHPFIRSYAELTDLDRAMLQSCVDPSNDVSAIYEDFVCVNKTEKIFENKQKRYYPSHVDIKQL